MSSAKSKRRSLAVLASLSSVPSSPAGSTLFRTPLRKMTAPKNGPKTPKTSAPSRANIHVCARFRPQLPHEIGGASIMDFWDDTSVSIHGRDYMHTFTYDRVFPPATTQLELYDYLGKDALNDLFDGYNGTILAYGQLGLGKLYTMVGPSSGVNKRLSKLVSQNVSLPDTTSSISPPIDQDSSFNDTNNADDSSNTFHESIHNSHTNSTLDFPIEGIIPRIIRDLFSRIALSPSDIEYTVAALYMEIYMEQIRDLLDKGNLCSISEGTEGSVYVKGLKQAYVSLTNELLKIFVKGNKMRATSATGMNAGSSRSHAIFQITLTQKEGATFKKLHLFLVDLAGLEKVDRTGAVGQLLEEAKKINKLLSALGNVIFTLAEGKATHIPFRDLKLTRILQELLGGNSRTTLLIMCSPSEDDELETLSTLRFGSSAKKIKNKPIINTTLSVDGMKLKIDDLEQELALKNEYVLELENRLTQRSYNSAEPTSSITNRIDIESGITDSADIFIRDQKIKELEDELLLLQMSSLRNHHEEQSKLFQLEKLLLSFSDKLTDLENANFKLTEDIIVLSKLVEERNDRISQLEQVLRDQQMQISKESIDIEQKMEFLKEKLQKQATLSIGTNNRPILQIIYSETDPTSPTSPRMGLNLRIVKPVKGGSTEEE